MTWIECQKKLTALFGWSAKKSYFAMLYFTAKTDTDDPDLCYGTFTGPDGATWQAGFNAWTPPQLEAQERAEQAYNRLTGGAPFVPGKQYVQDNGFNRQAQDETYTVVVTFATEKDAEDGYNKASGGLPFIPGNRYVQKNADGTFTTVVTFTLA